MRKIVIYQCSECGKISSDYDEILNCELKHLGLTKDQYIEWESLKIRAEQAGYVLSQIKNEENEKIFDNAIEELTGFMRKIGVTMDLFPSIE